MIDGMYVGYTLKISWWWGFPVTWASFMATSQDVCPADRGNGKEKPILVAKTSPFWFKTSAHRCLGSILLPAVGSLVEGVPSLKTRPMSQWMMDTDLGRGNLAVKLAPLWGGTPVPLVISWFLNLASYTYTSSEPELNQGDCYMLIPRHIKLSNELSSAIMCCPHCIIGAHIKSIIFQSYVHLLLTVTSPIDDWLITM